MTKHNLNLDIDNNDYYYRITKNKRNRLVQQKVNRPLYSKCDVLYLNNLPYDTIDNEVVDNLDYAVDNEYREYLMSIINSKISELDDRLKKILTLRIYYNKSIKEISKIFNLSKSRTNDLYNRSIRYLQIMCNSELDKHTS